MPQHLTFLWSYIIHVNLSPSLDDMMINLKEDLPVHVWPDRMALDEAFERDWPTALHVTLHDSSVYYYRRRALGFHVHQSGKCAGKVYPGAKLFQSKATHGIPLDITLDILRNQSPVVTPDWIGFVVEARKNGWWDFQTIDAIGDAIGEVYEPVEVDAVLKRVKVWMLKTPLGA